MDQKYHVIKFILTLLLLFKVILMLYLKVENLINLLIDLLGFGRVHKNITIMGR